jgi:4,4'-diaponeurosporenoate glycosyltransferase
MYPGGITELIEGWSKAFTSGARHTRAPVMAMITIWISGLFIAFFGLLKALAAGNWKQKTHAAGTYLLFAAQLHWHLVRIGRFSPLTAVLYPAPLLFFVALFTRSLIMQKLGLPVRWRGRTISGGGGLP